jgi:uncharacterized protein involved in exopolysaccharide biosynthesis
MDKQGTDILVQPEASSYSAREEIARHRSLRVKIFAITFVLAALVGLGYTFAQPATYRSEATLMAATPEPGSAQPATLQPQLMMGMELLAKTRAGLAAAGENGLSIGDIKRQLKIEAVADTGLISVSAQGGEPELLPQIINTWIDAYQETRETSLAAIPQRDTQPIESELARIRQNLEQAQLERKRFRDSNDIVSPEQHEREVRNRLQELQRTFKSGEVQEEKLRLKYEDLQLDIARGDTVASNEYKREIQQLERKQEQLETKLADLDKRYTREFLALQPKLASLPQQIEELEAEIKTVKTEGNQIVLDDARQAHAAAKRSLSQTERKIDTQKEQLKDIGVILEQYSALQARVDSLEKQESRARENLVQTTAPPGSQYPQLTVIERASVSDAAIGSNKRVNSAISLGGALVAAVIAAWLYSFLNPPPADPEILKMLQAGNADPDEEAPQLTLGLEPEADLEADDRPPDSNPGRPS